jgi:hypothetical protein
MEQPSTARMSLLRSGYTSPWLRRGSVRSAVGDVGRGKAVQSDAPLVVCTPRVIARGALNDVFEKRDHAHVHQLDEHGLCEYQLLGT